MLDKRCKYKLRDNRDFYLFIKYKQSHIFYAKFPAYNKTVSTGKYTLREAYIEAYRIYGTLGQETLEFHKLLLDTYKNEFYKTFNMAKKLSGMLSDIKTLEQINLPRLVKLQNQLIKTGISGKSVNNYMSLLRKLFKNREYNPFTNLSPVEHHKTIRKSFPIESFSGFEKHLNKHKYLYLAYISITTGIRAGEFKNSYPVVINSKNYLQVNGTKTENAVRRIPITQKTVEVFNEYKANGFAKASWKDSVYMCADLIGLDKDFVDSNNIVFHSFRKMFKTILESNNINNLWIEYYMGHSIEQSSDVNKLYFQPESADDSFIYNQVIDAMNFLK